MSIERSRHTFSPYTVPSGPTTLFDEDMAVNQDFDAAPGFFDTATQDSLTEYVQSMQPELVAQLSKPQSQEVLQVMERNIAGLLGHLPGNQFEIAVTTSKENLGRLLASAMTSGYFLRNAEIRHSIEKSLEESVTTE